jgi:hypothetical protein
MRSPFGSYHLSDRYVVEVQSPRLLGHGHAAQPTLTLTTRIDESKKEVLLVASLKQFHSNRSYTASYLVDWDIDPHLWEHKSMCSPNESITTGPTSIIFYGSEPLVIARHALDRLPPASQEPSPYHVCVYLKMLF